MTRFITVTLEQRDVSCRVQLLDDQAPATAQAVWDVLPVTGDAVQPNSLATRYTR